MERRILVPLDGSELAEQVLPHAATLARATGSGLTLLQVVPTAGVAERMVWPTGTPVTVPAALEAPVSQARAYLRAAADHWRATDLDIQVETPIGEPARTIVNWATDQPGITMIAMTTHGRSGLGRWIFGSVAEKVLQTSPLPLLLVRATPQPQPVPAAGYRTILLPLDGSPGAEQAVPHAVGLAQAFGATLVLVNAQPTLTEIARAGMASLWLMEEFEAQATRIGQALEAGARQLRAQGIPARACVVRGAPADEILELADKEAVDLIVMASHGRGGWDRFWLGSVGIRVMQGATRPVLLVRSAATPECETQQALTLEPLAAGVGA